jgi:hypothetical protein
MNETNPLMYNVVMELVDNEGVYKQALDFQIGGWTITDNRLASLLGVGQRLILPSKSWRRLEITLNDYNVAEFEPLFTKNVIVENDATYLFSNVQIDRNDVIVGYDGDKNAPDRIVFFNTAHCDFYSINDLSE